MTKKKELPLRKHALLVLEDPGAALFMQYLPDVLDENGWNYSVCGLGEGIKYFNNKKINLIHLGFGNSEDILKKTEPSIIFFGFSVSMKSPLIELIETAKKNNINCLLLSDSVKNVNYQFWRNKPSLTPEFLIVPDKNVFEAFSKSGFNREKIYITGHPHFEYLSSNVINTKENKESERRKLIFPDVNSEAPLVLFISEPFIPPACEEINNIGSEGIKRTDIVLPLLFNALDDIESNARILIKPHPREDIKSLDNYLNKAKIIDKDINIHSLINMVDLVVGVSSALMVEAALQGAQTVSLMMNEVLDEEIPYYTPESVVRIKDYEQLVLTLKVSLHGEGINRYSGSADVDFSFSNKLGEILRKVDV